MNTKYMHTIEGRPAIYEPNEQICFMCHGTNLILCDSLRQIRREQELSSKWRMAKGFDLMDDYGYLRVKI